jgi:hypothetical protein
MCLCSGTELVNIGSSPGMLIAPRLHNSTRPSYTSVGTCLVQNYDVCSMGTRARTYTELRRGPFFNRVGTRTGTELMGISGQAQVCSDSPSSSHNSNEVIHFRARPCLQPRGNLWNFGHHSMVQGQVDAPNP